MKNKLEDYVVVIKDAVPTKLCDKAIKELKSVNWTQHKFYNHQTQKHNTAVTNMPTFVAVIDNRSHERLEKSTEQAANCAHAGQQVACFDWYPRQIPVR